jgi:hypothetical protein
MSVKKLSEEELQALRESICAGIQDFFDSYPWDAEFIKEFGE